MTAYGKELILDLADCRLPVNRYRIKKYFEGLCELIDMERCEYHFWDYEGDIEACMAAPDHLQGTSAIQFIMTSNITIHTLDKLGMVLINIFSCKEFDEFKAVCWSVDFFKGLVKNQTTIKRG